MMLAETMGVRVLSGFGVLCLATGCAQLLQLDDYSSSASSAISTSSSGAGGGSSTSTGMSAAAGVAGGGSASAGGSGGYQLPTCDEQDQIEGDPTLDADTVLEQTQCDANHQGNLTYLLFDSAHRGLVRFLLDPPSATAFAERRVARLQLELTNHDSMSSPKCRGSFVTQPLRTEWDEGSAPGNFLGANWCRRLQGSMGEGWDADGANGVADVGTTSGSQDTDCVESTTTIDLDPSVHAPWVEGNLLAVRITLGNGSYNAYSKENNGDVPLLRIFYCPP
jgi:hypothetical protein